MQDSETQPQTAPARGISSTHFRRFRRRFFPLLLAALPAIFPQGTWGQLYRIDGIPGLDGSDGVWLNNRGQIAAGAQFWDGNQLVSVGGLGGNLTYIHGLNDNGQIVGRSALPDHTMQGFLWQNGSMVRLPTLGGSEGFATGINNHGQIIGYTDNAGGSVINLRATLWATPTQASDLGALPGHSSSYGWAINNLGQAVGTSSPSTGSAFNNGAFFYNGSSLIPIVTGLDPFEFSVNDLNDSGQVVGNLHSTAFVWANGTLRSLGTLSGGTYSLASAINNQGEIAGRSTGADGLLRAFVYRNGQMIDLNTVVQDAAWQSLDIAYDINDSGQIVGTGTLRDGSSEVFLLTPIPEPSAIALVAVGVAIGVRRRRTRPTHG